MRYRIEVYTPDKYKEICDLIMQDKNSGVDKPGLEGIPTQGYLEDLAIYVLDIRTNKIVGFMCAIVGRSDTAFVNYVVIDKRIRKKINGVHVLNLLIINLKLALKLMGKRYIEGFVDDYNIETLNLHKKHGSRMIGKGYYFRKEIILDEEIKNEKYLKKINTLSD